MNSQIKESCAKFYIVSEKGAITFLPITLPNVELISKILSLTNLTVNFEYSDIEISHHTSNVPPHYLVKYSCQKIMNTLKLNSD